MNIFAELGKTVHQEWKRYTYDHRRFADIAVAALAESDLCERVDIEDICRWCFQADALPAQPNLKVDFGQPPLTVYADGRLYIEVLFWLNNTTAIHQHAFSGAFYVLKGASMHSVYRFEEQERISSRLLLGDVLLDKLEPLTQGDVHAIRGGDDYIHALFHLEHPSVTVVVRTYGEPENQPQYAYLRPHVAIDDHHQQALVKRQQQLFTMLATLDHPAFHPLLLDWLHQADVVSTFRVLFKLTYKDQLTADQLDEALDIVTARHGSVATYLRPVFAEEKRVKRIVSMRNAVTDADHRFLLALMITSPDPAEARALIQQRYPDGHPTSLVLGWVNEMNSYCTPQLSFEDVQRLFGGAFRLVSGTSISRP